MYWSCMVAFWARGFRLGWSVLGIFLMLCTLLAVMQCTIEVTDQVVGAADSFVLSG